MANSSSSVPVSTTTGSEGATCNSRSMLDSPCPSGSDRSNSTTSRPGSLAASTASAMCVTWSTSNRERATSLSSSRRSRASPGLSSTRSSRSARASSTLMTASLVRGQAHHGQPEVVDGTHHGDELLQIHGLVDVAIGVQIVGAQDVLLRLGRGEHHHGDAAQARVLLDLPHHLPPPLPP